MSYTTDNTLEHNQPKPDYYPRPFLTDTRLCSEIVVVPIGAGYKAADPSEREVVRMADWAAVIGAINAC